MLYIQYIIYRQDFDVGKYTPPPAYHLSLHGTVCIAYQLERWGMPHRLWVRLQVPSRI